VSKAKNYLRIMGVLMALVGVMLLPFGTWGATLLIAGLVLLAVAVALPGSLYGDSPDPSSAPMCPQCGLRMIFVQCQPDAVEYRCNEHGPYVLDSEGLTRI
jgi:hypothetical protein